MTDQSDITALADAVRESGIALKPGDVLAVRLPMSFGARDLHYLRQYGECVEAETGIKVAFVPGEEFAHTTVNIHVTMHGMDAAQVAGEVRRELEAYRLRDGGGLR